MSLERDARGVPGAADQRADRSAASAAPAAAALATVRIVPSTGRTTAWRASTSAWASAAAEGRRRDVVVLAHGLGDAAEQLGEDHPGVAPGAHQRAVGDRLADVGHEGAGGRSSSSASTEATVSAMFVPVSPSGTG